MADGTPNPVPPNNPGISQDVSQVFLRTWPSLATAPHTTAPHTTAPHTTAPHKTTAGSGRGDGGRGAAGDAGGVGAGTNLKRDRIPDKDLGAYLKMSSNGLLAGSDPLISDLLRSIRIKNKDASKVGSVIGSMMGGGGEKGRKEIGMSVNDFHHQLR